MTFDLSILDLDPKRARFFALETIRLVSKRWNAVACPCLWQSFPLINLSIMPRFKDNHSARIAAQRTLRYYMVRSRPLPISFTFHFWIHNTPLHRVQPTRAQALEWLSILLLELGRWERLEFRAPRELFWMMASRIQDGPNRVPLLSKFIFEIQSERQPPRNESRTGRFDLSGSPRLKHVELDPLSSFRTTDSTIYLVLPWEQLEVCKCPMPRDTAYTGMVENGTRIVALKSASGEVENLPSSQGPEALQRLTKLSLCFGSQLARQSFVTHLESLTLPSLKELEEYWWRNVDVDPYSLISSLIRRSGCSLERLATENSLDHAAHPELQFKFLDLLRQCSGLTHLDIGYLTEEELGALVPNKSNTSKKPALSNLRVLTLRFPHGSLDHEMDPVPVLAVIQARTDQDRKQPHSKLEDVYIKHNANDAWRVALLSLGSRQNMKTPGVPFDLEFLGICRQWKGELREYLDSQPVAPPSKVNASPQLARAIKGMVSFDLSGRDIRILPVLGIPRLLDSIGRQNQQARELLTKWKPNLLEAFRSSPYRWCFVDGVTSRLRFVGDGSLEPEDEKTIVEQNWERILGRGDIDDWAAAPKGSMWQMGPLMLARDMVIVDSEPSESD